MPGGSIQDLEQIVSWDDARCSECGGFLDGDNVSVEAFEASGELLCEDCHECLMEDLFDDEEDDL